MSQEIGAGVERGVDGGPVGDGKRDPDEGAVGAVMDEAPPQEERAVPVIVGDGVSGKLIAVDGRGLRRAPNATATSPAPASTARSSFSTTSAPRLLSVVPAGALDEGGAVPAPRQGALDGAGQGRHTAVRHQVPVEAVAHDLGISAGPGRHHGQAAGDGRASRPQVPKRLAASSIYDLPTACQAI